MTDPRYAPEQRHSPLPQYDLTPLGRLVRTRRRRLGLSVDQLADRSGLPRHIVQGIEQASTDATLRELHAIASALSVPLDELVASGCTHPPEER
jgi:transcriptional regulator with XRE-family HTH domain